MQVIIQELSETVFKITSNQEANLISETNSRSCDKKIVCLQNDSTMDFSVKCKLLKLNHNKTYPKNSVGRH